MKRKCRFHIGTSGWNYEHWKEIFYPENLKQSEWLQFYSKKSKTVEINNSFYNLPKEKTFDIWRNTVPKEFIFSIKASRFITHMKKLNEPENSTKKFFQRIKVLKDTAGPVLFQLPPRWHFNEERLKNFLKVLPKKYKYAFEFRDETWWNNTTYEILKNKNAAYCIFELGEQKSPKEITADFIYIRLHGPKEKYCGNYNKKTLDYWADAFSRWAENVSDIYCYFDNDAGGFAIKNAIELNEILN